MLRVSQDSNTKVRTVARVLVAVHDGTATPEDRDVLLTFERSSRRPAGAGDRPRSIPTMNIDGAALAESLRTLATVGAGRATGSWLPSSRCWTPASTSSGSTGRAS